MLGLKRIDHIGVIVEDLTSARHVLEEQLGMTPVREIDDATIKAVFLQCGDASVELLEMKDEQQNRSRLRGFQAALLEHVAIEVVSLESTLKLLDGLGIKTTGSPKRSGAYRSVWTMPETTAGITLQFTEKDVDP